jgi:hypothetical protein
MLRIWASIDPKVIVSDSFPLITFIATLSGRMLAASTTRWQKLCPVIVVITSETKMLTI